MVELIVCIATVGLLLSILLPAVQQARESARQAVCQTRLRELGLASHLHLDSVRHFPSNGWGFLWLGEPERGFGEKQPGGWAYNVLPFLGQSNVREMALTAPRREEGLAQMAAVELKSFACPTRGGVLGSLNPRLRYYNSPNVEMVGRTDYAICEGDTITDTGPGPPTLDAGDTTVSWRTRVAATGISFQVSEVTPAHVLDGLSQTLLIGEKLVNRGEDPGHDQAALSGVDLDLNRWSIAPPVRDMRGAPPSLGLFRRFGSAHANVCQFVMADGAVFRISFNIDYRLFRSLGHRDDAHPTNWTSQ